VLWGYIWGPWPSHLRSCMSICSGVSLEAHSSILRCRPCQQHVSRPHPRVTGLPFTHPIYCPAGSRVDMPSVECGVTATQLLAQNYIRLKCKPLPSDSSCKWIHPPDLAHVPPPRPPPPHAGAPPPPPLTLSRSASHTSSLGGSAAASSGLV